MLRRVSHPSHALKVHLWSNVRSYRPSRHFNSDVNVVLHHHTVFLPSSSVNETEQCRPWNGRDEDHASGTTSVGETQARASNRKRKV